MIRWQRFRLSYLFICPKSFMWQICLCSTRAGKHTSSVPAEWDGAPQRTWPAASIDRASHYPSAGRCGSSDLATGSLLCCRWTAAQSSPLQLCPTFCKPGMRWKKWVTNVDCGQGNSKRSLKPTVWERVWNHLDRGRFSFFKSWQCLFTARWTYSMLSFVLCQQAKMSLNRTIHIGFSQWRVAKINRIPQQESKFHKACRRLSKEECFYHFVH